MDRLQKFDKLKFFELDLSIDAPNIMFEYMRSAGIYTWEQMSKLIDDLTYFKKQNSNWFHMCFNASIQAYNYDTVLEFDSVCRKAGALNNTRMLIFPEHFRLNVLPYEYRKEQFDKIYDYKVVNDPRFKRTHMDICKNLLQEQANESMINKFKELTIAQDKYRNMNIKDYHPQLAEFIYE